MCNPKCSKYVLIVVNIIFILLGLGLLIPGILVVVNDDGINDNILPALQQVDFGVSNFGDLAKGLSITLIVMGSFVLVLSMMGACGACCESKLLLVVYIIVVGILFLGKLVIVILWIVFKADVESKLREELKIGLKKFTNDDLTTHEVSTGWNYLNMNFECCGIDAVTALSTGNDYTTTAWYATASNEVPISCCPGVTSSSYLAASASGGNTCTSAKGTLPVGHYSKGCYDALKDFANTYSIAFICVGVFILLVEIAAIIFACSLCKNIGKDHVV